MNIVFDLDGTLTRYPSVLSAMMIDLHLAGHRITILTATPPGETLENRMKMINACGIEKKYFDDLVMVPEDYGISKARYCSVNNVDLFIDDCDYNHEKVKILCPKTACLKVI